MNTNTLMAVIFVSLMATIATIQIAKVFEGCPQ